MEISNINQLPTEILLQVISYLKPEELGITVRVCQLWKEISEDPLLWTYHCNKKYEQGFLSSFGDLHPKAAWLLPNNLTSNKHQLKIVKMDDRRIIRGLQGSILLWKKIGGPIEYFDLKNEESIPSPDQMKQDNFSSKKFQPLSGLEKLGQNKDLFFFESNDKKKLVAYNIAGEKIAFEYSLDSPIHHNGNYFFCSNLYSAVALSNKTLFIINLLDNSKNFNIPISLYPSKLIINDNWLLIIELGQRWTGKYEIWSLSTQQLHLKGSIPYCNGDDFSEVFDLTFYQDYLFFTNHSHLFQLSLKKEKDDNIVREFKSCEGESQDSSEIIRPQILCKFDKKLFFADYYSREIYYLNCKNGLRRHKIEMDYSIDPKIEEADIHNMVFNGRYAVMQFFGVKQTFFCDFLDSIHHQNSQSLKKQEINTDN